MEIKKAPKVDLENKKGLFLEIGLVVAIGLMILMFSYSQKEVVFEAVGVTGIIAEEELVIQTIQEDIPKPEPPRQQTIQVSSEVIQLVKNDTQISTEFTFSAEFMEDAIVIPQTVITEEVVAADIPYQRVENMPKFGRAGELEEFRQWVFDRLNYPPLARENGVQGTVTVKFIIERDGTLTIDEIISSPDQSLTDEAARVVRLSPKWTPGSQQGSPVRVFYVLPITFQLNTVR